MTMKIENRKNRKNKIMEGEERKRGEKKKPNFSDVAKKPHQKKFSVMAKMPRQKKFSVILSFKR
jgi:hypothetical protein